MVYRQILLYPVFKNQVGERVKGKKILWIGIRLLNVLEVCKLWKFPRENKESAHRGRNWDWCSHKPRNANIPQSWKRQEADAPPVPLEGYGCAETLLWVQCCVMDFRSPSLWENTFVLFEAPTLVFICYCSRWKHTGSEREHFFSLPFTGRRNLSLKTHCTPPLRSCELSSSFKDAEIEASGIFSLYKSLSANMYIVTVLGKPWHLPCDVVAML